MKGVVAIVAIVLMSIGAGFYYWPAGLVVAGACLWLDVQIERRS